jgi:hypothetical protein
MALSPTEIVVAILDNPTDLDHVRSLVTDDVTYVSLNYDDPDLKRIMPWCGTSKGPESMLRLSWTWDGIGKSRRLQSRRCLDPAKTSRCLAVSHTNP